LGGSSGGEGRGSVRGFCRRFVREGTIMRLDVGVAGVPSASAPAAPETRRLSHLYSPEQIAFVLQRERLRADRHRGEFSLVMFRSEADMRLDFALLEIAKIILEHARTTDEIGHYDKTSVCVVLP